MSDVAPFELTQRSSTRALLRVRAWPVLLGALLAAVGVACLVAVVTQPLVTDQLITAWSFGVGGLLGAAYVAGRAWRVWPAASPHYVVLRMDADGVALRRRRIRDDIWVRASWSDLVGGALHSVRTDRLELRFLTFRPVPELSLEPYPVGAFDAELRRFGLSDAEIGLTFAYGPSWESRVQAAISWLDAQGRLLPPE